jgi:preprotein translocase SecE subunit
MARTRQKAKQRKAKRLEQERKAAQRTQRQDGEAPTTQESVREIEEAQRRAAIELDEAQEVEVGAGAEAARSAAAAEAATGAEVATTERAERAAPVEEVAEAPPKPSRRERRRAEAERVEKARVARPERKRARPERKPAREPRRRGRVMNFFVQVWAELRRVQWPDRSQVTQATAVVVVFCAIAGSYLAVWDYLFSKLMKFIL